MERNTKLLAQAVAVAMGTPLEDAAARLNTAYPEPQQPAESATDVIVSGSEPHGDGVRHFHILRDGSKVIVEGAGNEPA